MSTVAELNVAISADTQGLQAGFARVQSGLRQAETAMGNTAKTFVDANGRIHDAVTGKFVGGMQQAEATTTKATDSMRNSLQQFASAIAALGVGAAALNIAKLGFQFLALKEQAQIAFTTMLGDGGRAKAFLDDLAAFAATTPFEFPELIQAAQRLKAMGFEASQVIPTLTAVGDAAAAMGGNAETINRITIAFTQMVAKGKVSAEEMRQLAEAGIPAWEILANMLGKTVPETMKLAEKGMINGRKAVDLLIEGIEKGTKSTQAFGGMMAQQSKTVQGLLSTIKDLGRQALGDILQPAFEKVRDVMTKVVEVLPKAVQWFTSLSPEIKNGVLAFAAVVAIGPAVVGAISLIGLALSALTGPVGLAVSAIGALVVAYTTNFGGIRDAVNDFGREMQTFWINHGAEIKEIASKAWAAIKDLIDGALQIIGNIIRAAGKAANADWGQAMQDLVTITDRKTGEQQTIFQSYGDWLTQEYWPFLVRKARDIFSALEDIVVGATTGDAQRAVFGGPAYGKEQPFSPGAPKPSSMEGETRRMFKDFADKVSGPANEAGRKLGGEIGKGIGKGLKDETFNQVKEWVQGLDANLNLSKAAWDGLAKSSQKALKEMRDEAAATEKAIDIMSGTLVAAFRKTNLEVIKLPDGTLHVREKMIELKSAIADVAVTLEQKLIPQFGFTDRMLEKIPPQMLFVEQKFESLGDVAEELAQQLPRSFNTIIDAILAGVGKTGKLTQEMVVNVRSFFVDVFQVIDNLPGKIGDTLRRITSEFDRWVNTIDGIIKIIQRLFGAAQTGLAGVLEQVLGVFKKTKDETTETLHSLGGDLATLANGVGAGVGKIIGSFTSLAGAVLAFAGVKGGGVVGGAISGALGTVLALGGIAKILYGSFLLPLGPLGLAAVGIGALIGALFGRKSELEKAQEAAALQKAKDAIILSQQQVLQSLEQTKQSILDTVAKARDILESIRFYDSIGKPAIKAFFGDLNKFMKHLAAEAINWAAFAKTDIKTVAENLGAGVELVSKVIQVLPAIGTYFKLGQGQIEIFTADARELFTRLGTFFQELPNELEKAIKKSGHRLAPGVDLLSGLLAGLLGMQDIKPVPMEAFDILENFLNELIARLGKLGETFSKGFQKAVSFFAVQVGPGVALWKDAVDAIKSMVDIPVPSTADFDNVFNSLQNIITRMIALGAALTGEGLQRAQAIAAASLPITAAIKSAVEALGSLREYKAVAQEAIDAIIADFERAMQLMLLLNSGIDDFVTFAESFEQKVIRGASALSRALAALGGGIQTGAEAMGAALSTIGGGTLPGSGGFGTQRTGAAASAGQTIVIQFGAGSVSYRADDPQARAGLDFLASLLGPDFRRLVTQGVVPVGLPTV